MVVIERESVAKKRGARVYSYITAWGQQQRPGDGRERRRDQKIRHPGRFRDANYGPEMVDLVECHATATVQVT